MRILAVIFGIMLFAGPAMAAPKAELWERWTAHDPASTISVDHSAWAEFLTKYVTDNPNGLNTVNYQGVSDSDKGALDSYVDLLAKTQVSVLNRDEQMAYWFNFYNALTLKVVLEHYPVESIRDIDLGGGFFSSGPWTAKLVTVEGEELSLDDMEHRILRPIWQDPRIHYGVNCASVGCPDLMARPFEPETLDADLTANAIAYINSPRGVKVDGDDVIVSTIYDWFQEDFDNSEQGVLAHIRQYASDTLKASLEGKSDIDDYEYDWALNE